MVGLRSFVPSIYYTSNPRFVPRELANVCSENHPLLTNAPGGEKFWLVKEVVHFVSKCIPIDAVPVWSNSHVHQSSLDAFSLSSLGSRPGSFGRVAIFSPSDVAAGNCNGFALHNGLHAYTISSVNLNNPLSNNSLPNYSVILHVCSVLCLKSFP